MQIIINIDDVLIQKIKNTFSRKRLIAIIAISVISVSAFIYAATATNLTTFTAGSTIVAEDVNANFQMVAPVGSITMYGAATAPTGWLLCDGSTVNKTDYAALYAKIGAAFGPEDATTFTLPDFRGVFPKGSGTTDRVAGVDAAGNAYAGTLGTYSQDKMQGHIVQATNGAKMVTMRPSYSQTTGLHYGGDVDSYSSGASTGVDDYYGILTNNGTHGSPRTGYTTEPQSLGVSFIIKY